MVFEVELSFERVVDRLDGLAERLEEPTAGAFVFALAGPAQQLDAGVGKGGFEVAAEVVLVGDQYLPAPGRDQVRVVVEQVEQDLTLFGLGAGQGVADGQPVQGRDEVRP